MFWVQSINIRADKVLRLARGMITHTLMTERDRFTYTPAGTKSHTHCSVCHFLISCCSVLKPLHPPCREQTLCSFLFVMLITLSLTVPHSACQLAFILFSFFLSSCRHVLSDFLGYVKVPPCIVRCSWNQLYYPACIFLHRNGKKGRQRKKKSISFPFANSITRSRDFPPLICFLF